MILRLFRGRAAVDDAPRVAQQLAGPFFEAARAMPGRTSFVAGMRVDPDGVELVIATTWAAIDDVLRATAGDLTAPARPLPPFIETVAIEHLELVSEPIVAPDVPASALVRVAHMQVREDREEEFYAIVRRGLADREIRDDLLAYHLGRRVADVHEAVAVSVWRSPDSLGLVVPDAAAPLWTELEPVLASFHVEHFAAVALSGR